MSETWKLAAILVANVVGYSRSSGAAEECTLVPLLVVRSDLIDPAIAVHHVRTAKRTGVRSIIEFRTLVGAVRCAIEAQSGLIERTRMGLRTGESSSPSAYTVADVVEESDRDPINGGVNIAARLEGVAKPGAIKLSRLDPTGPAVRERAGTAGPA